MEQVDACQVRIRLFNTINAKFILVFDILVNCRILDSWSFFANPVVELSTMILKAILYVECELTDSCVFKFGD